MSFSRNVTTDSKTHDAVETSGEVLERSAKKSTAVSREGAKRSAVGRARGQQQGWRPSVVLKHIWSGLAERKNTCSDTVPQCKTSLDAVVLKVSSAHSEKAVVQDLDCRVCLLSGI